MPYIQMTKTCADANKILLPGKIYEVSDSVAKELLADEACEVISKSRLPKTNKAKRRLMPSPIPDPEDTARHSTPKPEDPDSDDDEDDEEDE